MQEAPSSSFFFILTLLIALSIIAIAFRYLIFSDFRTFYQEDEIPATLEEHINYLENKGL